MIIYESWDAYTADTVKYTSKMAAVGHTVRQYVNSLSDDVSSEEVIKNIKNLYEYNIICDADGSPMFEIFESEVLD